MPIKQALLYVFLVLKGTDAYVMPHPRHVLVDIMLFQAAVIHALQATSVLIPQNYQRYAQLDIILKEAL